MHGDPGAKSPVPCERRPSAGGRRQSCGLFLTCVSNHAHETGRVLELDPGTPPRAVIFSGVLGFLGEWTNAFASHTPQHPYKYRARPRPGRLLFFFTMTNAAQEEFDELMRDKGREERHPEDRHNDSDLSEPESEGADKDRYEIVDTDDELELPADMRSNYYMPSHIRSEANTGPKGVIADAQAFEQAKKQARRFTWKKSAAPQQQQQQQYNVTAYQGEPGSSDEENDGGFMKQWRESRLRELQNAGQRIRSRTTSPSRRVYGSLLAVDGEAYLDAIEKTPSDTVVVVFIYNDLVRPPSYQSSHLHRAHH
jgi:hypothetical protein